MNQISELVEVAMGIGRARKHTSKATRAHFFLNRGVLIDLFP